MINVSHFILSMHAMYMNQHALSVTQTIGVYCLRLVGVLNIIHKISNNQLCPNWALLLISWEGLEEHILKEDLHFPFGNLKHKL